MREENKQAADGFTTVDKPVRNYTEVGSTDHTIKIYRETELVMPKPSTEELIDQLLESPEVNAALANIAADAVDDAQLDAAIDAALDTPEAKAMLDNVAAESNEWQPGVGLTRLDVIELRLGGLETALKFYKSRIESLESRVAAAMKHAGFKF
jgi:hypothetical protein